MNKLLAFGAPVFVLEREQWIPQPMDTVFEFFQNPNNLVRITPTWLDFKIISMNPSEIKAGTLIEYRLKWFGIPYRWVTLIESWVPGENFVDTQLNGPYILWHHTHSFKAVAGGIFMTDRVKYRLPLGPLGVLMQFLIVKKQLAAVFDYRLNKVSEILSGGTYYHAPREVSTAVIPKS